MVTRDQSRTVSPPDSWSDPPIASADRPLWRRALPLLVWLTCLVAAVVLLRALGGGRLAAPPLTAPGSWSAWAAGRDPLEVAMVLLRLLALGLAWYLTGVTSISVVARLLRAARLVRLADALSFGPVKVLVQQAVGMGLAASVLASAVPGTPASLQPATAQTGDVHEAAVALVRDDGAALGEVEVMAPVPAPTAPTVAPTAPTVAPTAPTVAPTAPRSTSPATDASVAPEGTRDAPAAADTSATSDTRDTRDTREPTDASPSGVQEVRVEPGDHFWAMAERDVARHLGRPGSELEVIAHWQAIVEANADRLEVPGNPDFLLPGQQVLLPPVTEARS